MLRAFDTPIALAWYKDGTQRVVSNQKIMPGDKVLVRNNAYQDFHLVAVREILEERKSRGVFKNESDRPFSYLVTI